jgi:hypothetical protein
MTGLKKAELTIVKLPCNRWPSHARFDG